MMKFQINEQAEPAAFRASPWLGGVNTQLWQFRWWQGEAPQRGVSKRRTIWAPNPWWGKGQMSEGNALVHANSKRNQQHQLTTCEADRDAKGVPIWSRLQVQGTVLPFQARRRSKHVQRRRGRKPRMHRSKCGEESSSAALHFWILL